MKSKIDVPLHLIKLNLAAIWSHVENVPSFSVLNETATKVTEAL